MQVIEDFLATARSLDHERFMTFFDHAEATTWTDQGGFFQRSWDKLYKPVALILGQWEKIDVFRLDQVQVDVLAENVAVITGTATVSGTLKTGPNVHIRQNGGYVLIRREDGWKIRYLFANTIPE